MRILNLREKSGEEPVTRKALAEMRGPILMLGLFSLLITVLMLAHPLYMMNLFDRVLTSMSVETLVALTIITIGLLVSMTLLEGVRQRLLVRLSVRFDDWVRSDVFDALLQANLTERVQGSTTRDIEQVRAFLTGQALLGFFDLLFVPVFLLVLWLIHPALGIMTLLSAMLVVGLGVLIELRYKKELRSAGFKAIRAQAAADEAFRNAEVVAALGMTKSLKSRWIREHKAAVDENTDVLDAMSNITSSIKGILIIVQILILAVAGYLVVTGHATAGALFAASILAMRVIMPVQQAVSGWRGFVAARSSFENLENLLSTLPPRRERIKHARPEGALSVERVYASAPASEIPILKGVSFTLTPGESLGVTGPSGSGKSTLARLLVGVWAAQSGTVRLDGVNVADWEADELGPWVGYLPQDIELFNGTIAENICRFGPIDDEAIIAAAKLVGLHEIILQQADGYDTVIKGTKGALSGGQRQRLGLARALYGNPVFVVLDEPNSNLDQEGEQALLVALDELKRRGTTVVLIAHNQRIINTLDRLLIIQSGKVTSFGPRQVVLSRLKVIAARRSDKPESPAPADETEPEQQATSMGTGGRGK